MNQFDEFRSFISDFGEMSWVVVCVKASIEKSTMAFSQILGEEIIQNASLILNDKNGRVGPYIPIIQPNNCDWCIVLYSFGQWISFEDQAELISKSLKTQVLLYEAEDTGGSEGMTLFENGNKTVEYLSDYQAEYLHDIMEEVKESEESIYEEIEEVNKLKKDVKKEIVADYNIVFEKLNINAIGLYPTVNGEVVVNEKIVSQLRGVNLIKMEYTV